MKKTNVVAWFLNGIGFVLSYLGFEVKSIPFMLMGVGLMGISIIIHEDA